MLVLAQRHYDCSNCYERFWLNEKFIARGSRVVFYLCAVLFGIGFWFMNQNYKGQASVVQTIAPNELRVNTVDNASSESSAADIDPPTALGKTDAVDQVASQVQPLKDVFASSVVEPPVAELSVPSRERLANAPEPLSRAEWRRQLDQARETSEVAASVINEREKQLNKVLAPNVEELKSLAKIEINYVIEQWRKAWSDGQAEQYLGFYSEQFTPSGDRSRSKWAEQRRSRINPERGISIELSNHVVAFDEGLTRATVKLQQDYRAGNYQDFSDKQLVFLKEKEQWRIIFEEELTP